MIPCLDEAESLEHVINEIKSSYQDKACVYEIVVADNGSTDGSQEIAQRNGARVVDVPSRGYGAALQGGIDSARGLYVVMGDADGSYLFGDAWPMIERLRNNADLVMGDRFAGGIAPGAMPWLHQYVGNPVLSFLGRVLFRVPVRDFHCGLRAFNVDKMRALGLTSPGMEFASEMVVVSQKRGLKIEEVPIHLEPDLRSRSPHLNTWRDGWRHLRFLLAHSPSWTFLIPAVLTGLLALLIGVMSVAGPVSALGVEFSYRSAVVASALAMIAAVAAWSFVLARATLDSSSPRLLYATEVTAALSIVVGLIGLVLVVTQFVYWRDSGFGLQPVGRSLLMTIWGALLFGLGGISFFFSLLAGLVRAMR